MFNIMRWFNLDWGMVLHKYDFTCFVTEKLLSLATLVDGEDKTDYPANLLVKDLLSLSETLKIVDNIMQIVILLI